MLRRFAMAMASCGALGYGMSPDPAYAKPRDTPQYLLPYYLKTTRSRFNHFASEKEEGEDGRPEKYMNAEDFLRSLLVTKKTDDQVSAAVVRDLDRLFRAVDANGDGKLSYGEYSMLMVFLTRSTADFRLAFHMFDEDETGTIGVDEFKNLVKALRIDPNVELDFEGGLTTMFFGSSYKKRVSQVELLKFVSDLKLEILKAEFRQFDPEGEGFVTPKKFCKLITNSMLGSHVPFYIVSNLRQLGGDDNKVGFEQWVKFSHVMDMCDDLAVAMQVYCGGGQTLRKEDFHRAVKAVSKSTDVSPQTVDLIYALFDKDGDGSLEYEEFISVVRSKVKYNHFHKDKKRKGRSPPQQFIHCLNTVIFERSD
jgi:Ca2+-binding EF-hand superfamily protein